MAWISPVSRATGFLVTAARWNQDVVDNGIDLNERLTSVEGDGAITTARLADGAVTSAKLGSSAVTTAKLANGAVTGDKLAASLLTNNAVGSYILARWAHNPPSQVQTQGAIVAGSNLLAASVSGLSSGQMSGTWRLMGYSSTGNTNWRNTTSLWVRIS